jgi:hypothetical protein
MVYCCHRHSKISFPTAMSISPRRPIDTREPDLAVFRWLSAKRENFIRRHLLFSRRLVVDS